MSYQGGVSRTWDLEKGLTRNEIATQIAMNSVRYYSLYMMMPKRGSS